MQSNHDGQLVSDKNNYEIQDQELESLGEIWAASTLFLVNFDDMERRDMLYGWLPIFHTILSWPATGPTWFKVDNMQKSIVLEILVINKKIFLHTHTGISVSQRYFLPKLSLYEHFIVLCDKLMPQSPLI